MRGGIGGCLVWCMRWATYYLNFLLSSRMDRVSRARVEVIPRVRPEPSMKA